MRRKYFFVSFAALMMLVLSSLAVSAQTGQLYGEVMLKQADGTTVPAVGATVDVYRTDLPGQYPNKTNKQGKFVYAGLPFVGTYVVAASAPNARPDVIGGVKAGRDINVQLTLMPGDGKRFSAAEAKSIAGTGKSGDAPKETEEERKKREEMLAKNAEIAAGNQKIEASNATINRTYKEGNAALNLKNYDEAITLYSEGINAGADHPGTPALLTNKSVALRARGVQRYNTAVTSTDDATKASGLEAAKKDIREAVEASSKSVELLKAQSAPSEGAALASYTSNKYFALAARAEAMRLFVSRVDQSQADAGIAAYQEYFAVETKPEVKAKAHIDFAQMLLDTGVSDKAFAEFQKILAENPENLDAMLGAGLALFQSGDKAKFQEAANFLQRFVDKAPDTHKLKASAKSSLDYLKSAENVKPEKTTTTGGRRRG